MIGTVQAFALACGFLFVNLYRGNLNGLTGCCSAASSASQQPGAVAPRGGGAALAALALIARPLLFACVDPDVAAGRRPAGALPRRRVPPAARDRRGRGQPDHRVAAGLRAPGAPARDGAGHHRQTRSSASRSPWRSGSR